MRLESMKFIVGLLCACTFFFLPGFVSHADEKTLICEIDGITDVSTNRGSVFPPTNSFTVGLNIASDNSISGITPPFVEFCKSNGVRNFESSEAKVSIACGLAEFGSHSFSFTVNRYTGDFFHFSGKHDLSEGKVSEGTCRVASQKF